MHFRIIAATVAVSSLVVAVGASPASAAAFDVIAQGTLLFNAPSNPNPVTGLGFGAGDAFIARWRIDIDASTAVDRAAPGLIDPQRFYVFAVSRGRAEISSASGITRLTQLPASFGAIIVLNDARFANPAMAPLRLDQVSITDGARVEDGLVSVYGIEGQVPAGVFLRSINFGISQVGNATNPPPLLTSVDRPDFTALLNSGLPRFLNFTVSSGIPASQEGLAALPSSVFSVGNPFVTFDAIPEPSSWAMLIAGFGLVGAAMRRARNAGAMRRGAATMRGATAV